MLNKQEITSTRIPHVNINFHLKDISCTITYLFLIDAIYKCRFYVVCGNIDM